MKTIEEFIQRLRNEPEFEQRAHSYENSDDFVAFVKSEGYDFTLDQLLDQFNDQPATDPPVAQSPVPVKTIEGFIQRLENDPEFEQKARAFENDAAFLKFVENEGYDFTLDQLKAELKQENGVLKPQAEKPSASEKAMVISRPQIPEGPEVNKPADTAPHDGEEGQKRPGKLYPKFEGSNGGRRRGMKWQSVDSDKS
jgi:predicted ribosomally synthesized peptide with nif11-like leader